MVFGEYPNKFSLFPCFVKIPYFTWIDLVTYLYWFVISISLGKTGSEHEFLGLLRRC